MIWQLIRRDEVWRWMPGLALMSAAFFAIRLAPPHNQNADLATLAATYCILSLTPGFALFFQHRDVYFQAPLPITVRQVYVSRVPPTIVLLWLPIAIGMALGSWLFRHGLVAMVLIPLICWIASGAIFLKTWQVLPEAFDFAPGALLEAEPNEIAVSGPAHPLARLRLVFSICSLHPLWFIYFFSAGVLWASRWSGIAWLLPVAWLVSAWITVRLTTRWLEALPVSRRALLAVLLLPILVFVCAGYETGLHIPWIADRAERGIMVTASAENELAGVSKGCKMFNVIPPLEYRVPAQADKSPLIRAPWGETFQAGTNWFDGFYAYNPYASGCDNSERFLDWQFARATAAVYGRSFPRDRAAGSYVVASSVGIPRVRKQLVTMGAIAVFLMLVTGCLMFGDWRRLHRLGTAARGVLGFVAFAPCGLIALNGDVSQWALWALPSNALAAVTLAVLPLGAIYWMVNAMFGQLEFIDKMRGPS